MALGKQATTAAATTSGREENDSGGSSQQQQQQQQQPLEGLSRQISSNSILKKLHSTLYYQNWTLIVSAISLVASIAYFIAAVHTANKSTEASLFNSVLSEYSNPDMLDSFHDISRFHAIHRNDYAEAFVQEYTALSNEGIKLEHSRRRLEAWYQKLMLFDEFDMLGQQYLGVFPGPAEGRKFVQLVEPLSRAKARYEGQTVPRVYAYVRRLYGFEPHAASEQAASSATTQARQQTRGKGNKDL